VDLAATLQTAWTTRGVLARALWPAGAVVARLAARRRDSAMRHPPPRLPVPVVVVGNMVVGGAGKTPVTLALIEILRAEGWRPGVVSRGYGRRGDGLRDVAPDDDAAACGDEPLLLRRRAGVPVVVGADRAAAARALLAAHPQVDLLVSDDGLQHHALPRDLQLVVFDERGVGNGWCLPAGPLREPMPAVPWPDTLVLYNAPQATTHWAGEPLERTLGAAVPLADWWQGRSDRARPLEAWRGQQGLAVAGTARPQRFFDALRERGLSVSTQALPDHHDFATLPWAADTARVFLTEKDAVKLRPQRLDASAATEVWVVPLHIVLPEGVRTAARSALPRPATANEATAGAG
jgi:tetraacyldisaccharide 4'-kinase